VSDALGQPFWFQLYMIRDRAFMADLLDLAQARHCAALVFTVDMPVAGARYRDYRSGLAGAPSFVGQAQRLLQVAQRPAWAWDVGVRGRPHTLGALLPVLRGKTGIGDFFAWMGANFDPTVTWDDLRWVRERWKGPLILKGILDVEDAQSAVECGADAIVVSNHGGRQLDGVQSTARALPRIADAVGDRLTVLADGGVRSGLDVARMLALGAKGVLLGRAWAYALAGRGQAGIAHVLSIIEAELRTALALTGIAEARNLNRESIEDIAE
jgi:L-lactate dehydrogenase (cytochrome)